LTYAKSAVLGRRCSPDERFKRQRQQFLRNGRTYDILLYGLLRQEFLALFPAEASESPIIPSQKEPESR
jgi:hypothetical protein